MQQYGISRALVVHPDAACDQLGILPVTYVTYAPLHVNVVSNLGLFLESGWGAGGAE